MDIETRNTSPSTVEVSTINPNAIREVQYDGLQAPVHKHIEVRVRQGNRRVVYRVDYSRRSHPFSGKIALVRPLHPELSAVLADLSLDPGGYTARIAHGDEEQIAHANEVYYELYGERNYFNGVVMSVNDREGIVLIFHFVTGDKWRFKGQGKLGQQLRPKEAMGYAYQVTRDKFGTHFRSTRLSKNRTTIFTVPNGLTYAFVDTQVSGDEAVWSEVAKTVPVELKY